MTMRLRSLAAPGESREGQKTGSEKSGSGRLGSSGSQDRCSVQRCRIEIAKSELDIHLQQTHLSEREQLGARLKGLWRYRVTREVLKERRPGCHAIQRSEE